MATSKFEVKVVSKPLFKSVRDITFLGVEEQNAVVDVLHDVLGVLSIRGRTAESQRAAASLMRELHALRVIE